jgi:uncharacterized Ntn-hydrolase superfamily protein
VTYSIVARDPETGEIGVAVQTRYFAVGSVVPWVEPGVGAVATQAFAEKGYGPRGLALLRQGRGPREALDELLAADEGRERRQVAILDASGAVAVHTGSQCVQAAGHVTGEGVSAQGNMLERDIAWAAMLRAYGEAEGDLAARLLAALGAAQAEGGDMRGRQSAALVVAPGGEGREPWERRFDVRVDDHPDPIDEIGRLLRLARAFEHGDRAGDLAAAGDMAAALTEYDLAVELTPDDDQMAFWRAGVLAGGGRFDEARAELDRIRAIEPRWPVYLRRLGPAGLFPDVPELFDAIAPLDEAEAEA